MPSTRTKTRMGAKVASTVAIMAGSKVGKRVVAATDNLIAHAGEAAKRRRRARTVRAALQTAGKIALVAGTAGAVVLGGRAVARNHAAVKAGEKPIEH